jgi:predicted nucleotidyltransferase
MKPLKASAVTTENPELADRFNRILQETVEALEDAGIRYAFIGGVASGGLGRPRSTHDIDVFVRPEDAELTLRALAKRGFKTERTDPVWLYKGMKEGVLVDIIFKSKGEIYLDTELYQRSIKAEFHGKELRLVAPEDLIIIKAAAHSEMTPGHWHDALALLTHANIDWDYLIKRARRAPRRILSLLIYAQSSDVWVPKYAVDQLFQICFGDILPAPAPGGTGVHVAASAAAQQIRPQLKMVHPRLSNHSVARLMENLAEDPRTNELDIQIDEAAGKFLLRGEVMTAERRDAVMQIAHETFPDSEIESQIRILQCSEPTEAEEIK